MKMLVIVVLLTIAGLLTPAMAAEQGLLEVASYWLDVPVGRVLLVKRGDFLGAIKFLHNEEKTDGRYSKYEHFEFQKGGVQKLGGGEAVLKRASSGGFLFHRAPSNLLGPPIKMGGFTLCASAGDLDHAIVYFWSKPHKIDQKVRMAPTPWKEIGEVNPFDPRIKWFTYDDKRKGKVIPIDTIWD